MRLRPLTPEDLTTVMDLEAVLFGAGSWSRASYEAEFAHPGKTYVAAVEDEDPTTLLGWAGVALDPEWTVTTIGVSPHAQRRGVGTALLDALIAAVREAGGEELFLEVRANDGAAAQMYRNAGFSPVALRRKYYQPEGLDAVVMRLPLPPARPAGVGPVGAEAVTEAARPQEQSDPRAPAAGVAPAFVDVTTVRRAVWSPHAPVLLDVRWALGRSDGRESYCAGHLPGAVFVDLETELAAPASPALGRHPLPSTATLQEAARRWGITAQRDVVVYDDAGGTSAARAWWLLRAAGLRRVSILDGGLRAWVAAGEHLEEGAVRPRPSDITLADPAGGTHLPVVDADGAAALAASTEGVLLDARAGERFRGELEPVDPRAGHIRGAVSAPTTDTLTGDGHLRDNLRERFAALGVSTRGGDAAAEVAVYCGSGVTASHTVAVLASLGVDAALYPGSFSQWSNDPAREVATGP